MEQNTHEVKSMNLPKWIVLQLLEKCNLRCHMCYEWGDMGSYHQKKDLHMLELETIQRLVEDCKAVTPYYELFGGEPLLYPRIGEVISLIKRHGSSVDMATNGVLLQKSAEVLVDTELTRVWVSLDGPEAVNDAQRGKGTYRKALEGMDEIFKVRLSKGKEFPKVGVTTIVTPQNYRYIETFFFELVNKRSIEHISIEFQTYATCEQYVKYKEVMEKNFNIPTDIAKGLVQELKDFEDIDAQHLASQIRNIKNYCTQNNITFYNNPNTIDGDNYRHYFSGSWEKMSDKKKKCIFPWLHAEITASGDVAMCHTFHDLTFGNINNRSMREIWNNALSRDFRKLLKAGLLPMCTACSRYYTHTGTPTQ